MSLRAYPVRKTFGDEVFNCYHPQEWFERLCRLDKFENGMWMEFTEEELQEMEADTTHPLSDEEKQIVADIRTVMNGEDCLYLEYY